MTKDEAVKWLDNLIDVIGKPEHRDLWDYEQALTELKEMIESSPEPFNVLFEQYNDALESAYAHGYTAAECKYRDKLRECEDAVSRETLRHIFEEHCYPVHYDHNKVDVGMTLPGIVEVLNIAPSVTPKPRTGYWIRHENADIVDGYYVPNFECSECHGFNNNDSDFCPDCGAKMQEKRMNDECDQP